MIFDILKRQGYVIIAEIGVNYYDIAKKESISLMDAAKKMCLEAKKAGADSVKFQTYKADKLASVNSPSYWDRSEEPAASQYELFQRYDLFEVEQYQEIAAFCAEAGILFLSTPFDFTAADELESLMEVYKISSSDITNLPFIRHICAKKKPVLLSTGAATEKEVEQAVEVVQKFQNRMVLMHCVLEYPTPDQHANLGRIKALREKYPNLVIGYSDHTKPERQYDVIKTAYTLGAKIIEKHFTLDKTLKGNDHYHAMDVSDLRQIKKHLERLRTIIGPGGLDYQISETPARKNARRSIVLANDLEAGAVLRKEDLVLKRPGTGIAPDAYEQITGRRIRHSLKADSLLQWEDLL